MISIKNILTESECNLIIKDLTSFSNARVYNKDGNFIIDKEIRNVLECRIPLPNWFEDKIKLFLYENGYEIQKSINFYAFLKYTQGCYFKQHTDSKKFGNSNRKVTVIVELSDREDYQGGEFILDSKLVEKNKGDAILFNYHDLHELKEVISGDRISFVGWVLDTELSSHKKSIL